MVAPDGVEVAPGVILGRTVKGNVGAVVRGNLRCRRGDQVDVDIELDTEPREVTVPADFRRRWTATETPAGFFDACS
jgi:hypothetical protein